MRHPLARSLERLLADHFGRHRTIRTVRRRRCPTKSTFAIEELDVEFAGGESLALVMKDLSPARVAPRVRRVRPPIAVEPRREIDVYRSILPHAPSGTAVCYGALTDARRRHHHLFLERIDGVELPQAESFSAWTHTAKWIGRFHRTFTGPRAARLTSRVALLTYDEAYYRLWIERAHQFAADARRRRVLDRVARVYESVVARLIRMRPAIIHGDFYPANVMIGGTHRRVRVCPVDWEMTAVGPALIDLASLVTGWREPEQRALVRAYRAGAGIETVKSRRAASEFAADLDCCRLHLAVRMLGWSRTWTPPSHQAHDWTAEALRIVKRLQT